MAGTTPESDPLERRWERRGGTIGFPVGALLGALLASSDRPEDLVTIKIGAAIFFGFVTAIAGAVASSILGRLVRSRCGLAEQPVCWENRLGTIGLLLGLVLALFVGRTPGEKIGFAVLLGFGGVTFFLIVGWAIDRIEGQ